MNATTNKAIFLDRDGVLNREIGDYVTNLNDFELLPHIEIALKHWQEKGYLLFICTNQAGIAKGLYSEQTLQQIHEHLIQFLLSHGVHIKEIYYCPHHPDYSGACDCRKPMPGMLLKAIEKYSINPYISFMIGDTERDIQAAQAAKVHGIKVESNSSILEVMPLIP